MREFCTKGLLSIQVIPGTCTGRGVAKLLELLSLTNLPVNIGAEQKQCLPAPQAHNFEQGWGIWSGRVSHGLFLLVSSIHFD